MPQSFEGRLNELREEGARRFARWDGGLFDAVVRGAGHTLAEKLAGQDNRGKVLEAYWRLVQEGVGAGLLRQAAPTAVGWSNFLERCLVELVPERLATVRPDRQLSLLVKVWNLGEGLAREPEWVGRYVGACAGGLDKLDDVEAFLTRTLGPVLTPPPPAVWKGPFAVTVLDLRPLYDEFLPGALHLAAPTVLRVQDRRRPGVQAGVLLRPGKHSQVLGLTQGLGEYADAGALPAVAFEDQRVRVAGQAVDVPLLRRCAHHVVARAGFVTACAVDSQRLWIVETP